MFIHSEARIEGVGCAFADTQEIIDTGRAAGATDNDVNVILGLKHAWEYLFDHYNDEITFDIFAEYNYLIQENYKPRGGEIRTAEIVISNCDYIPEVYDEKDFYNVLDTVLNRYSSNSDRALALLFMLCKHQFFWDGNKRSSQILVNHYLAHVDAGIYLLVPDGDEEIFHSDLVDFYEGCMSLDDITRLDSYIWRV